MFHCSGTTLLWRATWRFLKLPLMRGLPKTFVTTCFREGFTVRREDLRSQRSNVHLFKCRSTSNGEESPEFRVSFATMTRDFEIDFQVFPEHPYIGSNLILNCTVTFFDKPTKVGQLVLGCESCVAKPSPRQPTWNEEKTRGSINAFISSLTANHNGEYACAYNGETKKRHVIVAEHLAVLANTSSEIRALEETSGEGVFTLAMKKEPEHAVVWKHVSSVTNVLNRTNS